MPVVINASSTAQVTSGVNGEVVVVTRTGSLAVANTTAILLEGSDTSVTVHGDVWSGLSAVRVAGANGTVVVATGGMVTGATGVDFGAEGGLLRNAGFIASSRRTGDAVSGVADLTNTGDIVGSVQFKIGSASLYNSGMIAGGVNFSGGAADSALVYNTGEMFSVIGSAAEVTVINDGKLGAVILAGKADITNTGNIFQISINGNIGPATIRNHGTISGQVNLSSADDVFDSRQGEVIGPVFGGGGDDTLLGGDGADIFRVDEGSGEKDRAFGYGGDDALYGGAGDLLDGGIGDDSLYVGSVGVTVVEATNGGYDTVHASVDYLLPANIEVLRLQGGDLRGYGNTLSNALYGTAGGNLLDGRSGADRMEGFAGNDLYVVDNAGDIVIEAAGGGSDKEISSVSRSLSANVENLALTGTASIFGAGNGLNNIIDGNEAANALLGYVGADTLRGLGGNDTLYGGLGNDTLTGGLGSDIFVFETALGAANVDTITDFSVPADTIHLQNAVFTALTVAGALNANAFVVGTAAADALDRIIYNSTTGALLYDADGAGGGPAVRFAQLVPGLAMTSADFLVI